MATMKRCLVPMTLSGRWGSEHLWPGLEVNVERELAPGFTVADAVVGREECFEDVSITMDGGPTPAGFSHVDVGDDVDLSHATMRPIEPTQE
jgi:hypothetical protein